MCRASLVAAVCLGLLACGAEPKKDQPAAPSCTDKLRNGTEVDVDCGGTCAACGLGAHCAAAGDCAGGHCDQGLCVAAPTCADKLRNGAETDVDCGGGTCAPCPDAHACLQDSDCEPRFSCQNKYCAARPLTCLEGLDCTQNCAGSGSLSCPSDCVQRMSPTAQAKLVAFSQCIDGACPTRNGGVCDSAAVGYQKAACTTCIDGSLADPGGPCTPKLNDCVLDP